MLNSSHAYLSRFLYDCDMEGAFDQQSFFDPQGFFDDSLLAEHSIIRHLDYSLPESLEHLRDVSIVDLHREDAFGVRTYEELIARYLEQDEYTPVSKDRIDYQIELLKNEGMIWKARFLMFAAQSKFGDVSYEADIEDMTFQATALGLLAVRNQPFYDYEHPDRVHEKTVARVLIDSHRLAQYSPTNELTPVAAELYYESMLYGPDSYGFLHQLWKRSSGDEENIRRTHATAGRAWSKVHLQGMYPGLVSCFEQEMLKPELGCSSWLAMVLTELYDEAEPAILEIFEERLSQYSFKQELIDDEFARSQNVFRRPDNWASNFPAMRSFPGYRMLDHSLSAKTNNIMTVRQSEVAEEVLQRDQKLSVTRPGLYWEMDGAGAERLNGLIRRQLVDLLQQEAFHLGIEDPRKLKLSRIVAEEKVVPFESGLVASGVAYDRYIEGIAGMYSAGKMGYDEAMIFIDRSTRLLIEESAEGGALNHPDEAFIGVLSPLIRYNTLDLMSSEFRDAYESVLVQLTKSDGSYARYLDAFRRSPRELFDLWWSEFEEYL